MVHTIHHASHPDFNVESYSLIDVLDLRPEGIRGAPQGYATYLRNGGKPCVKVGQCSHCGANLRFAAIMEHEPTGERIMVGEDCLFNRFSGTQAEFAKLRKAAADRSKLSKIHGKAETFLRANEDLRRLVELGAEPANGTRYADRLEEQYGSFVFDVISKLSKYGDLSPAQVNAVRNSVAKSDRFATQRTAEKARMVAAPTGRLSFTGEIVGTKLEEGYGYGAPSTTKLIIMTTGNFKVYVTAPASLLDIVRGGKLKGLTVTMTATLAPSKNDETFAIGKRPTFTLNENAALTPRMEMAAS